MTLFGRINNARRIAHKRGPEGLKVYFTNLLALVSIVVSAAYAFGFYFSTGRLGYLIAAPLALSYLLVPAINSAGKYTTASRLFLLIVLTQITIGTVLFAPPELGLHFFLLSLLPAAYLLGRKSDEAFQMGCIALSLFLFIIVEAAIYQPLFPITIEPSITKIIHLTSVALSVILTTCIVHLYNVNVQFLQQQSELEYRRADHLLHNIFPPSIARRLKRKERSIADNYEEATVLFADIVGFTKLSAKKEPVELLRILNRYFYTFDIIMETHQVYKVKTIGDAYMAVGGVPNRTNDHLENTVKAALEMLLAVERIGTNQEHPLKVRIGIHTGPVVAGVLGQKRSIFDLWGDTVNIASRLESAAAPNTILVSKPIYEALHTEYPFQRTGEREFKGLGQMETYRLQLDDLRLHLLDIDELSDITEVALAKQAESEANALLDPIRHEEPLVTINISPRDLS